MTAINMDPMPGGEEMVTEPVEVIRICGTCGLRMDKDYNCLKCKNGGGKNDSNRF